MPFRGSMNKRFNEERNVIRHKKAINKKYRSPKLMKVHNNQMSRGKSTSCTQVIYKKVSIRRKNT